MSRKRKTKQKTSEKTNPYDQAFKFLAEDDPESLLILLGAIEPGEPVEIELLPREVGLSALFPDQPYLIRKGQEERIKHVEAQTEWPDNMPERMTEYALLLWLKNRNRPIDSYVLLLTPRGLPENPPQEGEIGIDDLRIVKRLRIIRLWEISAVEALASGREALLPFVPLMDGERAELEQGAMRVKQVRDEPRRNEMAKHFLMLGGLRYNRYELLELVGRTDMIPLEQLKRSDFYQYILDEGREEGREEGLEAVADLFRLFAGYRFPGIQLGAEVEAVGDIKLLQQLCHELDQIPTPAALRQRLAELASARQTK